MKVRFLLSTTVVCLFAFQSLAGERSGVSPAAVQEAQALIEKEAAQVNMAGVWAVDQLVTSSDCPGVEVGERGAMLLLVDQKHLELSASAVGHTNWSSYIGSIYNSGNIQLQARDADGAESAFELGLNKDGTLSGKRTAVAKTKPCTAVRKVRAKRISVDKPW